MKNKHKILTAGIGSVGVTGLAQFAQNEILKHEAEKKNIEAQLIGLGYESNAEILADWLIKEAENVSLVTGKSFSGLDLLQVYQNKESSEILSKNGLSALKTAFKSFGKSVEKITLELTAQGFPTEKWSSFRPKSNQKWYNQFQKRRKR
jgi:hypothetical protein